mmetsp:Transcript_1376/g.2972  ORF Transcript_1376/g.2972 Transcript_1376/m.2972 type:complete len:420 (-) Transcript_1376:1-1260(-)
MAFNHNNDNDNNNNNIGQHVVEEEEEDEEIDVVDDDDDEFDVDDDDFDEDDDDDDSLENDEEEEEEDFEKQDWRGKFIRFVEFRRSKGHCHARGSIGRWIAEQHEEYRRFQEGDESSSMTEDRIQWMESVRGFSWKRNWDEQFRALIRYHETHGNFFVPHELDPQLYTWTTTQRARYKENQLPRHLVERLDSIGFVWEPYYEHLWNQRFGELAQFHREHGHWTIPSAERPLLLWASKQRYEYRKLKEGRLSSLTAQKIDKLESIGFDWTPKHQKKTWDEQFQDLVDYRNEHGHCNIPRHDEEHVALDRWMRLQRPQYVRYRAGKPSSLTPERVARLQSVEGYDLTPRETKWNQNWDRLRRYVETKDGSSVASLGSDNPSLAQWLQNQLALWKRGRLSKDQIERLGSLGVLPESSSSSSS